MQAFVASFMERPAAQWQAPICAPFSMVVNGVWMIWQKLQKGNRHYTSSSVRDVSFLPWHVRNQNTYGKHKTCDHV